MAEPNVVRVAFTDRLPGTSHPEHAIGSKKLLLPTRQCGSTSRERGPDRVGVLQHPWRAHPLRAQLPLWRHRRLERLCRLDRRGSAPQLGTTHHRGQRLVRKSRAWRAERCRPPRTLRRPSRPPGESVDKIVGVVPDLGMIHDDPHSGAGIYHAVAPGAAEVNLAVHVKGDAGAFARGCVTSPPRSIRRCGSMTPSPWMRSARRCDGNGLSLAAARPHQPAGAVAVAGRNLLGHVLHRLTTPREIGIRVALGAHARQIVVVTFARAFAQVVFGIGAGGAVVLVLTKLIIGLSPSEVAAIGAYMALMLLVCLLACILPTRRALSVEPAEALRVDG